MFEANHLVMRFRDNHVFAGSQCDRSKIARAVLGRDPKFGLLAFRGADTHIHALVAGSREEAGEFARRVEISIQRRIRPNVRFAYVHVSPVRDQQHLYNAFFYILRQEQHHGTQLDPYHDMSNLPDLLGLRLLGDWTLGHVRSRLPRINRQQLLELYSVGRIGAAITSYAPLAAAAMAAGGVGQLDARAQASRDARVAAVHAAPNLSSVQLASLLELTTQQVRRARSNPANNPLLQAVNRQLKLRQPAPTGHDSR